MANVLFFVLGNFTLTFFVVGLIVSAATLARAPRRSAPIVIEALPA